MGCLLALWGGSLSLSAKDRTASKAATAAAVEKKLESRDFRIDITLVQPVGLATFTPSRGQYFLTVKDAQVGIYLPYVGRGYDVPYGGGPALHFTAPLESYQVQPAKKGSWTVMLSTTNDQGRSVFMTLTVYPNGSVYLRVRVDGLQMIGYSGNVVLTSETADNSPS